MQRKCKYRQLRWKQIRSLVAGAYRRNDTRITQVIQNVPQSVDSYFQDNIFRRLLWCWISLFAGFYSGNMVSLAFGTLAINDVVAAMVTVAVTEVISRAFYAQWPRPPLWLIFANFFKMGVTFAFMADSYKLAG